MKRLILQRWNVVALVFLIAVFSVGTFCIRQKMVLKADKMSRSLVHGSTKGYQKFLNRYFEQYSLILNRLDYVWHLNNKNPHELVKSLHALMLTDSAIVSVVVEDGQLLETHADSLSISPIDFHLLLQPDSMNREFTKVFRERYLFMGGSMSNHSNCYRGIVIDLYHLHKQFIDSDVYTSIYQVILNQRQQCIYHPDIAMVGKQYPLSGNVLVDGHFNNRLFDSLHTIQSDYLQLPVFAEYNPLMVMGEQWIVLSVSPGFELKDMMAGQERSLLLLFFLFLLLLVGIMIFSLLRWKREFLLRASYEQKNLNLQLKQLKQDSETISIKLELLRSGLNSHFMFNSLGTVKALLSKQDQKAREMLSDLAQLYRYQLKIEGESMVTLAEELKFTQTYVAVINIRMNGAFTMEIHDLECYLNYRVVPVSLQVLVENCIKHNVASEQNPLVISISVQDRHIIVENELRPKITIVESNGKGLQNLNARCLILTNQACSFQKENGRFVASIPLLTP